MLVLWLTIFISLLQSSSAVYQQSLSAASTFVSTELQRSDDDWDLNKPLTSNSTANLVFATISSLLQSAPNLRYRNGHTLVPGIIRSGTLLYHGRGDSNIPTMEWVAFDPEASYIFCKLYGQSQSCWLHTFRVERFLRILYFDGSSAAKIGDGAMDSQDILTWGEIKPDLVREEGMRIRKLCEWGAKVGLDGFVRTASISEMMLCDFSPLQLISSRHIKSTPMTIPLKDRSPVPTPRTPIGPLPITSDYIDFLRISGRFDHYPGMMQVQLDLAHFVSLYDEKLAPSLSTVREGKPRLRHRLLGMSQEDILRVKLHLEEQIAEVAWSSLECAGNHLDWSTHLHSIVDLYRDTFEDLWYIINSTISLSPADVRAENAFRMIESIVRPFVLHSVSPTGTSPDIAWASSVFKECALSHASAVSAISFTNSEELLRNAIEGTTRELCRVMTKMWTDGVHEGMSPLFGSTHKPEDATFLLDTWKVDLGNLIDWLDWGTWMRCRPACKQLEFCYLPAWPFGVGNLSRPAAGWHEHNPQPRCLRKIPPFIYADDFLKL
ncbi:hypothetical protein C8R41DRAFT_882444 [Lentinula lateritia]|uniref:Uncharacterized protein n=1 Tax=Lentinula lateritia TaxID=40482 RepID=A0ABQ8VGZ8_9AGAR|nr:hypothetical protein C8R41DRAFT_882444 [Lentinula lateritia]